jgi:hypothetical protein
MKTILLLLTLLVLSASCAKLKMLLKQPKEITCAPNQTKCHAKAKQICKGSKYDMDLRIRFSKSRNMNEWYGKVKCKL